MGTGTGRRAEIKGRRGDEFVKKAEAGQRHASGTSKRQDEMKSNRRHPARKNLLSSCPRSRSFIRFPFPRSFRPARRKPVFLFYPFTLGSFFSLSFPVSRSVEVLHIRSTSNPLQASKGGGESKGKTGKSAGRGGTVEPFKGSGGRCARASSLS